MRRALFFASAFALAGCGDCSGTLQRMWHQPGKYTAYEENPFFEDKRSMRPLVEGTVSREKLAALKVPAGRGPNGEYHKSIPIPLTPELVAKGRKRFDIICATCHGPLGDGKSLVAQNMSLRPPPSLHDYADRPVGRIYDVITHGFGLMPRYDIEIPPEERWAVVAYVRALQLSQRAPLSSAPPAVQQKLLEEASK